MPDLTERQQDYLDAIRAGASERLLLATRMRCSLTAAGHMLARLQRLGAVRATGRDLTRQGHPRRYEVVEGAPS